MQQTYRQTELLINKLSKEMDALDFTKGYAEKQYAHLAKRQETKYEALDNLEDEIEDLKGRKKW